MSKRRKATKAFREHPLEDYPLPRRALTTDERINRERLAEQHVPGFCGHPYASEILRWPPGVRRASALLRYFQHHGSVTLSFVAGLVSRAAVRAPRPATDAGVGR